MNVLLAYIPYEIAVMLARRNFIHSKAIFFWPFVFIWLLFYPNAPYLITDFFHLSELPYKEIAYSLREGKRISIFSSNYTIWMNFFHMILGVFLGITFGFVSLGIIGKLVRDRVKKLHPVIWISGVTLLSSYAIYIGRFQRLHSIELFVFPKRTLAQMMSAFKDIEFWPFFALMTGVQIVLIFVWNRWIFAPYEEKQTV